MHIIKKYHGKKNTNNIRDGVRDQGEILNKRERRKKKRKKKEKKREKKKK